MRDVTQEVRELAALNLDQLRGEWRRRGYGAAPTLRSIDHVRRLLAWRLQAEAFGGLSPELKKLVLSKAPPPRGPKLAPGQRLAREWRGVRHEVEVLERGFGYRGGVYRSLSEVAREISGVRWNGPRFFGLRQA